MKILIITHYNFGSKPSGATNRVLELAKAMGKYASIEVIHRGSDMVAENLRFIGYKSMFPFNSSHWISDAVSPYISYIFPGFYRAVKEVIHDVNVIQVEQPYLLIPVLMIRKTLNKNSLIVLDEHNVDFASVKSKINGISFNSLITTVTLPYVFLSENLAVKNADFVLCVSQTDRESLMKLYGIPENRLLVVPNGVNLARFEKSPLANDSTLENRHTVFFHGTLNWYPNTEARALRLPFKELIYEYKCGF